MPGPIQMLVGDDTAYASIHVYSKEVHTQVGPIRSIAVSTIKLDDLQIPNDDRLLVLKIDVQGHDVEVLRTGPALLEAVQVAIIEVPFVKEYEDRLPSFAECLSLCQQADLYPVMFHEAGRGPSPYPIEQNVVFVKSAMLSNILGY
jgi:hypothetical protein